MDSSCLGGQELLEGAKGPNWEGAQGLKYCDKHHDMKYFLESLLCQQYSEGINILYDYCF